MDFCNNRDLLSDIQPKDQCTHSRMLTMSDYFFLDRGPPDRFTIGLPVQNTIFQKCSSVDDSTVVCNSETCSKLIVLLPRNYVRQDINN